ncbi:uncharacterized protein [Epargyreus clarus]|uniref:uncharacterized protein n=1 Tax=Epargyreus clarus TaxID=520877 RepID=UPI003C2ADEE2
MMKLFILMLFFYGCLTFDVPNDGCQSDLTIDDDHYNVSDTYHTGEAYPADAHYDHFGNLFYVESGQNAGGFYFDIKMIRPKNDTPENVPGLPAGLSYSIASDKKKPNIYFGTGKGIFSYSYETQRAKLISDPNLKLNMIFVDKDGKKYITENNNGVEELYLLDGKKKILFKTLQMLNEMAIDNENNFYFIKEEKFYVLKSKLSTPTFISNVTYNGFAQISFYEEKVFIASDNLAYTDVNNTSYLKNVENVPKKVTAIAFDKNGNFVLGSKGKMVKYNVNDCYVRKV